MVSIITDSSSEMLKNEQEKHNIIVLPMPITFGEDQYLSGENLSNTEFYAKLKDSSKLPTTSMVNSFTFQDAYRQELDKGNDIVVITISSKLSVTYSQAVDGAKEVDAKRIFVIDSLNASLGQSLLVLEAIKLRDSGASAQEIYEKILQLTFKTRLFAVINTLKYLKAGGRLSGSQALIGTMLNVKPIVCVEDGKVVSKDKALGRQNAFKKIAGYISKCKIDTTKEIIVASADDENIREEFKCFLASNLNIQPTNEVEIGSTIGVHIGPEAVAIAFIEE